MARTRQSSRESSRPAFSLPLLLSNCIHDLSGDLGGFAEILSAELHDPRGFRQTVENILSYAEHSLGNSIPFFAAIRQIDGLCSKYPSWGSSTLEERRENARAKFLEAEARCRRTNKRMLFYRRYPTRIPRHVRAVLNMAIDLAHRALGPCEVDWERCCFGPGVTASSGRSIHEKLNHVSTTPGAAAIARGVLPVAFPHWVGHLLERGSLTRVKGDRITFVPKSAKTERTIGIQSSLQVFLQKGAEAAFTPALRRLGVTLDDQGRNRAVLGRWDELATIDLSAASDSISVEVARLFLPPDWWALVFGLSSRFYTFDKKGVEECDRVYHRYEKLSAMGNCTTFPVETLLFACISQACVAYTNGDISLCRTYGDDIIVPKNSALLVLEVLRWLGFVPNRDKTFVTGPFRESCGRDVLWGVDIRPVYLRKVPSDDTAIYGLHNRLLANPFGFALPRTLAYLRSLIDRPLWGPAYLAAGVKDLIDVSDGIVSDWYAGKSSLVDGFFWSPKAHHEGVTVFTNGNPTTWWYLELKSNIARFKTAQCEATSYLAFLLGWRGGDEVLEPRIGIRATLYNGEWPWPFATPGPNPKTRPASSRVLRKITDGVIWS